MIDFSVETNLESIASVIFSIKKLMVTAVTNQLIKLKTENK